MGSEQIPLPDPSVERKLYIMEEKKSKAGLIRNILLVVLPALFLALLCYNALSGRFAKPVQEKRDTTPPSIMLTRDNRYFVQPGGRYEEEGYAAYDDTDGDLTRAVQVSINGDIVRYRVSDSAGNIAMRFRKIPYADTSSGAGGESGSESGDPAGNTGAGEETQSQD